MGASHFLICSPGPSRLLDSTKTWLENESDVINSCHSTIATIRTNRTSCLTHCNWLVSSLSCQTALHDWHVFPFFAVVSESISAAAAAAALESKSKATVVAFYYVRGIHSQIKSSPQRRTDRQPWPWRATAGPFIHVFTVSKWIWQALKFKTWPSFIFLQPWLDHHLHSSSTKGKVRRWQCTYVYCTSLSLKMRCQNQPRLWNKDLFSWGDTAKSDRPALEAKALCQD